MPDLFPVTLDDQIACVEREIRMRERVYPHQVNLGRMNQEYADRELARMRAVLSTLTGPVLGATVGILVASARLMLCSGAPGDRDGYCKLCGAAPEESACRVGVVGGMPRPINTARAG